MKLLVPVAAVLLLLSACSSNDDNSSASTGRKGGSAPSAATVVVSKGNVFHGYADDINKAKALQRQSVQQAQPDLDKQMDQTPPAATNAPPPP